MTDSERIQRLEAALIVLLDRQCASDAREADHLIRIQRLEALALDRNLAAAVRLIDREKPRGPH